MRLIFILLGLYPTAEAFFICLAVNLLTCNAAISFGKTKSNFSQFSLVKMITILMSNSS